MCNAHLCLRNLLAAGVRAVKSPRKIGQLAMAAKLTALCEAHPDWQGHSYVITLKAAGHAHILVHIPSPENAGA